MYFFRVYSMSVCPCVRVCLRMHLATLAITSAKHVNVTNTIRFYLTNMSSFEFLNEADIQKEQYPYLFEDMLQ